MAACAAAVDLLRAARDRARGRWEERRDLLGHGVAGLDSCAAALAAVAHALQGLEAELASLAGRQEALETSWRDALSVRLSALSASLEALHRATVGLEARYPAGRGVRDVEETARARQRLRGESAWIAAAESLRSSTAARFETRLREIVRAREPAFARDRLDSLLARSAGLHARADSLAEIPVAAIVDYTSRLVPSSSTLQPLCSPTVFAYHSELGVALQRIPVHPDQVIEDANWCDGQWQFAVLPQPLAQSHELSMMAAKQSLIVSQN